MQVAEFKTVVAEIVGQTGQTLLAQMALAEEQAEMAEQTLPRPQVARVVALEQAVRQQRRT